MNLPTAVAVVAFGFLCAGLPSARSQEARTGDSCLFRANEIEVFSNCVLRDGQGKLFIAQDYVKELVFDSHGLAPVFDGMTPSSGGCTSIETGALL